jgi:hypothetical protein
MLQIDESYSGKVCMKARTVEKNMVTGDSDYNQFTPYEICRLQQQAVLLVQAYNIAEEI